jgi:hypothetical protein
VDFQQRLEKDGFAEKVVFSDEATFHMCGKVNRYNVTIVSVLASSKIQKAFLSPVLAMFHHDCLLAVKPANTPWRLLPKQIWRDSPPTDMLLSVACILTVALPSSEVSETPINYRVQLLLYAIIVQSSENWSVRVNKLKLHSKNRFSITYVLILMD